MEYVYSIKNPVHFLFLKSRCIKMDLEIHLNELQIWVIHQMSFILTFFLKESFPYKVLISPQLQRWIMWRHSAVSDSPEWALRKKKSAVWEMTNFNPQIAVWLIDAWSHRGTQPYVLLQLNSDDGIVSWDKRNGVSLVSMLCHSGPGKKKNTVKKGGH